MARGKWLRRKWTTIRERRTAGVVGNDPMQAPAVEDAPVSIAPHTPLEQLAAANAGALRDTGSWLHRRVERIAYTDDGMIARSFSVDFTIPRGFAPLETLDDGRKVFYLPVALLRKWPPLMRFDLQTDDGRTSPLLTSLKNRRCDAWALLALAPECRLKDDLVDPLRRVALQPSAEAQQAFDEIAESAAKFQDLEPEVQEQWRRTLRVAGSLARNSILWARVVGQAGERHIVKCSFQQPVDRELVLRRRLLAAFSWGPYRLVTELPNLGERGSYHLEVTPPQGLSVQRSRLVVSKVPPTPGRAPRRTRRQGVVRAATAPLRAVGFLARSLNAVRWAAEARWLLVVQGGSAKRTPDDALREPRRGLPYRWNAGNRAYFYISDSQDQYGLVQIDMGVGDRGILTGALAIALSVVVLMSVLVGHTKTVIAHIEAAVSLLALVPVVLGLILVRSGEHPILRSRLAGVRALTILCGGLPIAAATVLVAMPENSESAIHAWWVWLRAASITFAVLLACSWLLPAPDVQAPKRWWRRDRE
jgi:hypothetical protein